MTTTAMFRQRIAIALLVIITVLVMMLATAIPTYSSGGTATPIPATRLPNDPGARWGS